MPRQARIYNGTRIYNVMMLCNVPPNELDNEKAPMTCKVRPISIFAFKNKLKQVYKCHNEKN